jgi:hypothetical protein
MFWKAAKRERRGSGATCISGWAISFEGDPDARASRFSGQARGERYIGNERISPTTAHGHQRTADQVHARAAAADQEPGRARHNRRATSWGQVVKVKIFDLSWNVDLNRLENEINDFLATLPSNAVKHVQSTASSTRTRDTDQMQTDYLVTVWYEGGPKKPAAKKSARR